MTPIKRKSMPEKILVESNPDHFCRYSTEMNDVIGIYVETHEKVNGSDSYRHESNDMFLWRVSLHYADNAWFIGPGHCIGKNIGFCFSDSETNSNNSPVFSVKWQTQGRSSFFDPWRWRTVDIYVVKNKFESDTTESEMKGTKTGPSNLKVREIQNLNNWGTSP
jgi:hypothetical protein